jgi:beta-glucuronidase
MLYPRTNRFRQVSDLGGFWDFRFDPEDRGRERGWGSGFSGGRPIAVPASWNDQLASGRDCLGPAWYQTTFTLPGLWSGDGNLLRFDSVNYAADVFLNGELIGSHEGGHLPFPIDVGGRIRAERNTLVVRVDGRLAPDRVPPGDVPEQPLDSFGNVIYPPTAFDFFPFCGIHRPVQLCLIPQGGIEDIIVETELNGSRAVVRVRVTSADHAASIRVGLSGFGWRSGAEVRPAGGEAEFEIEVPTPSLWSPETPHLYDLTVEQIKDGNPRDEYALSIGIRSVAVEGDALLLNGKPVYLKGFGRHEDFPVTGRGFLPAVIIKDYELMSWVGANSFRTTHYPYSEQMMDLADRLGFLVIDETPAVGLFFLENGLERRRELCIRFVKELIARDRNHPSVIAWSLANEPHSRRPAAKEFFRELYDTAKTLDPSRPVTLASYIGAGEEAFEFLDLVCLNRYHGWYSESGRIEEGCARLSEELDALHAKYPKPVILTEFGADTVPGCHAVEPEMFSEEYQEEFLERHIAVLRTKPYVVGEHVWNLCDFKTSQEVKRFGGMNLKGVFTRDRRPKMAAHLLRRLWKNNDESPAARICSPL